MFKRTCIHLLLILCFLSIPPIVAYDPSVRVASPREVGLNYQLMKLTDQVLRKHNIFYWACGGTLLGTIRNQGFIPWDLDCDLCIRLQDLPRLLECKNDFNRYGAKLFFSDITWMVYKVQFENIQPNESAHVDIFFSEYDPKQQKVFHAKKLWPAHWWYPEEIGNTKRAKFGPIEISIPEHSTEHLKRAYGNDVFSTGKIIRLDPKLNKNYEYTVKDVVSFEAAPYEAPDSLIPLDTAPLQFND